MAALFCSISYDIFVLFFQLRQLCFVLSAVAALFCSISCDSFVLFYQLWQLCYVLSAVTALFCSISCDSFPVSSSTQNRNSTAHSSWGYRKNYSGVEKKGTTMLYSAKYNLNHRINTGGSGCNGINPRALYSSRHFILVENIHANQSEILSKCLSVKSINWL